MGIPKPLSLALKVCLKEWRVAFGRDVAAKSFCICFLGFAPFDLNYLILIVYLNNLTVSQMDKEIKVTAIFVIND